uniref:Putative Erf family protein n=1 Tax=viral metagenome TaxID=1070528 RepID=A0A6M3LIM0_9ZZZZ
MEGMIYKQIAAIAKEVGAITKSKKNAQQGFMYRGIDDVYFALQPLLAQHEVFTVPEVLEDRVEERTSKSGGNLIYRVLKIRYTFYASDGSSIPSVVIGEGMDSGDKAANKAMAVAHKYALLQTFCVPTEQVDPDAESHEVGPNYINEDQLIEIQNLLKETNANVKKFLAYLKVESVEKIPVTKYNLALSSLMAKKAKA